MMIINYNDNGGDDRDGDDDDDYLLPGIRPGHMKRYISTKI